MKDIKIIKKVISWFKSLSTTQLAVGGAATALTIAGVVGGMMLMNELGVFGNALGTEGTQISEGLVPGNAEVVGSGTTEELEMTETTEVTEVVEEINVRITTTSIEKDLKIKIVDDDWDLVYGFPFVVTLTHGGESADYEDHDMDGIIHVKDIEGGDYVVKLHELEGIIIEDDEVNATVKSEIVYEQVEIENEIKDETQVDVSVEDTAQNDVVVENPIVDTLPLLESSVTTTEVGKDKVDMSKLPAAVVSTEKATATMEQYSKVEVEDSEEDTENSQPDEVTGQNSGSLEPQDLSVGSTGATQTITIATAKAYLPKKVTLYALGNENSTSASIQLQIEDEKSLIKSYTWSLKDESVATITVADDKKSAKLTAIKEGTTKVVISFVYISDEDGVTTGTYDLECEVAVVKHTDTTTQLVDVDGNPMYVDSDAKTKATPADLASKTKFYINPKYTGWATIDGSLYYYTAENVPATGTQIIGGVTYEFHEDGTLIESEESIGIDVSKWQEDIDWEAVANAGIDFAIIRCGYRGSSTGAIVEDKYFRQNIQGATANGIKVGVYFFTQAITEAEAVEEASAAIAMVQGYRLNYPIFIDTEGSGGRADGLGKTERTAIIKAFCETVRNAGYKPGVYASKYWYYDNLDASQLSTYHIWVAQYSNECNYRNRYDMWQYTSKGSVPGINGNVDMNISYTKY